MGQIIGSAAKPKRCNLQSLSSFGTPAAGEYILVSSDNSMNAAGQGNFDCYIVGDGTKAAAVLELKSFAEKIIKEKTIADNFSISTTWTNGAVYYNTGSTGSSTSMDYSDYIDISQFAGKQIVYSRIGVTVSSSSFGIAFYNSSKTYISGQQLMLSQAARAYIPTAILVPNNAVYIRVNRLRDTTTYGDFYIKFYHSIEDVITTDSVATKGSKQPIQSGAVYNDTHLMVNLLPNDVVWTPGYVYYNNGTLFTSSTLQYYSSKIDVSAYAGKNVVFSRVKSTSTTQGGCAFYTSEDVYISGVQNVESAPERGYEEYEVQIPSTAKYARFTRLQDAQYGEFYLREERSVKDIAGGAVLFTEQELDSTQQQQARNNIGANIAEIDISRNTTWQSGNGVRYDTGGPITLSSGSRSDYIDVHKYVGMTAKYSRMCLTGTSKVGIAFFNGSKTYISGVQCNQSQPTAQYEEAIITIPSNAYYVICTKFTNADTYGDFYFKVSQDVSDAIEDVYEYVYEKTSGTESAYTDSECVQRFYTAMNEKCAHYGITGQTIVSPAGYNANTESKYDLMKTYDVAKLVAIAAGYPFMANIWSEDAHVIKTRGVQNTINVQSTISKSQYGSDLTDDYDVLAWKGGTKGALTNLCAMATCDALEGNVLVGVISRTYTDYVDSGDVEGSNRYLAMKYLMDIGKTLFLNRSADVSTLQTSLLGQDVTSAVVVTLPAKNPRLIHRIDLANSQYFNIYSYNPTTIQTMSMIKLLTAVTALDYIPNLDAYVEIKAVDITNATGGSGPIFTAGQKVTYRDLFYGMMLPSSNQAAFAIARCVGGYLLDNYDTEGFIPTE